MHALFTAIALWVVAVGVLTLGTTYRDSFGQLKWTDFVHFFTMGHVAQYRTRGSPLRRHGAPS